MSQSKWRIALTAILIILALVAFWDTFKLWTMSEADKAKMQENDPGDLLALQQEAIRLGLDLQGGIHVVLRVKLEELDAGSREDAVDRAMQIIRNRVDGLGVAEPSIVKQGNDRIIVDLPGYTDAARAEELIGQTALLEFKMLETSENAGLLLSRIDSVVAEYERKRNADIAAEEGEGLIEDLVDTTAESEADTTEEFTTPDLMAELAGETDSAVDTAGMFDFDEPTEFDEGDYPFTQRLEQALYSSRTATGWPCYSVAKRDYERINRWLSLPQVAKLIPIDVQFAWSTRSEVRNSREVYLLYLVKRKVQFVGKYLENIQLSRGQMGDFVVNFQLSGDGAARFAQLTGANIDKPLAIVIDDKVESAPFINSKIRSRGQITMGSSASVDHARNMEIVLKAGALPAPVEIIEKNIVGASLGADSIKKGFTAALFGLGLVLVFIAIYYRLSGIIADVGLVFNIFFLLAIMSALGATLTMPGIAGIILTHTRGTADRQNGSGLDRRRLRSRLRGDFRFACDHPDHGRGTVPAGFGTDQGIRCYPVLGYRDLAVHRLCHHQAGV